MGNSIQDQAMQAASRNGHQISEKSTISQYEQMRDQSSFLASASQETQQRQQAISKYYSSNAQQSQLQGQNFMSSGSIKTSMGIGFVAMGAAMMAIPFVGPAQGFPMMTKGFEQIAMGAIDKNQGKKLLAMANQALEQATQYNVLSKDEGKTATKETARSKMFEDKIQLLKQMLSEIGVENENLTEEQLKELKEKFTQNFDKFFEDAATSMLNGGVMAVDGLQDQSGKELGTQYFIKEGDDFYAVDVPRDENGDPIKGAQGEPLIKKDGDNYVATKVEDGDLKELLKIKFRFVDELKKMATGLTTTEFDSSGNQIAVPYDLNNQAHLQEFVDLVFKTNIQNIRNGTSPAPLQFSQVNGHPGLQKVQWDLDPNSKDFGKANPTGTFVSFDDLAGGIDPRTNGMESYTQALQISQNALQQLGLNQGGNLYNYVAPQGEYGYSASTNSGGSAADTTEAEAFQNFLNSTSLSSVRSLINSTNASQDLLNGSVGDALPEGQA